MKALTILVLALLVGVGAYVFYQQTSPTLLSTRSNPITQVQATCLLNKRDCSATVAQGQVTLSLNPKPTPLMKDIQVQLTTKGLGMLNAVHLKIEGLNMYMGFQTADLKQVAEGEWHGSFSLPICSESQMHWQLTVDLKSAEQAYQTNFQFITQR